MRPHPEDAEHPPDKHLLAEGLAILAVIIVAALALLAATAIQASGY
jgi:hypothetical protein